MQSFSVISPTPGARKSFSSGFTAYVAAARLLPAALLWWLVYRQLAAFSVWFTYTLCKFPREAGGSRLILNGCCAASSYAHGVMTPAMREGRALAFLLFQLPHTFLLLALVVFVMGIVRSFFSPQYTRRLLAGRKTFAGNLLAALLGVVTPFCSCSAAPLFVGFVTAGVPLGITFTFLVAAPLVNEIALALLYDTFGWHIALIYLLIGMDIALLTGWLMQRFHMERYLEPWVTRQVSVAQDADAEERITWDDRLRAGMTALRDILGRVWLYVLTGILAGTLIFALVSPGVILALLGARHWWSVPLAVLVGVPIYANAAGIIPIVQALLSKSAAVGTVLAFMMAVVALSLPEFIILRKVMQLKLIVLFALIVSVGILIVGWVFNAVM